MKKVMVYAYTRFNLGDDLFIKILTERYPDTRFFLYAPKKYEKIIGNNQNVVIVPSDNLVFRGINFIFRKINLKFSLKRLLAQKCDISVQIGGSLFIENQNWRDQVVSAQNVLVKNQPFLLLGSNFGPYKNTEFYEGHRKIFSDYYDICFREKVSYELFQDLKNVRMANDIVFQLNFSGESQEKNIIISVIKPSIRQELRSYDYDYYNKMKEVAIRFIDKGYNVTLMSFCKEEGDVEAIDEIMKLIPNNYKSQVDKYLYDTNIDEALSIISKSSYVVATRFHAMILGWVANKPVFPISYSKKMTNVMSDVEFQGTYCDIAKIKDLDPNVVVNSIETNKLLDITNIKNNSQKQFEKLDELLRK